VAVQDTSTARGSKCGSGLTAEELIPSLLKDCLIPFDLPPKLCELVAAESMVFSERDWRQPELRVPLGAFDVNVSGLLPLVAK
jgi:hypothetical protein